MLKHSRWVCGAALAAMLGGGSFVMAQEATADADALFAKLDKNNDGKLTKDEVPEEQARFFERLVRLGDKDQDGVLTKAEFQQANKPAEKSNAPLSPGGEGSGGRGGDARQRFQMLDRNQDGKVSLEEVPEQFRERLKPFFDRLGKTELSAEEFARLPGPGGQRPDPKEMFKQFDKNSDGKLSRDELPEPMRDRLGRVFERLGKDELTPEEWAQATERMRRDFEARGGPGPDGRRPEGAGSPEGNRRPEPPRGDGGPRRPDGERGPGGERRPEGPRGPVLLRKLDQNNDGRLSKDELSRLMDLFEELDTNHDGHLDPAELIGGPAGPPRDGDGPRGGNRRQESDRPADRRPDGERRPEGDRDQPRDRE